MLEKNENPTQTVLDIESLDSELLHDEESLNSRAQFNEVDTSSYLLQRLIEHQEQQQEPPQTPEQEPPQQELPQTPANQSEQYLQPLVALCLLGGTIEMAIGCYSESPISVFTALMFYASGLLNIFISRRQELREENSVNTSEPVITIHQNDRDDTPLLMSIRP